MERKEELNRIHESLQKEINDLVGTIRENSGRLFSDDRMQKALDKEKELEKKALAVYKELQALEWDEVYEKAESNDNGKFIDAIDSDTSEDKLPVSSIPEFGSKEWVDACNNLFRGR